MSGKSQTIGAFTFCRPSQIYRIIATILSLILPMNLVGNGKCAKNWNLRDRGTGAQQFGGLVMSEIHRWRPRQYKFEFSFVGKDRWPSQKSGTRRENRKLPIPQICPRPSQTIRDIYDFEFSLVGKIWDGRETVKSLIVWNFPNIWNPGFNLNLTFG